MVARLKLKGIDGRAPPGVKCSSASEEVKLLLVGRCTRAGDIVKLPEIRLKPSGTAWLETAGGTGVERPRVR